MHSEWALSDADARFQAQPRSSSSDLIAAELKNPTQTLHPLCSLQGTCSYVFSWIISPQVISLMSCLCILKVFVLPPGWP